METRHCRQGPLFAPQILILTGSGIIIIIIIITIKIIIIINIFTRTFGRPSLKWIVEP